MLVNSGMLTEDYSETHYTEDGIRVTTTPEDLVCHSQIEHMIFDIQQNESAINYYSDIIHKQCERLS